MAHYDIADPDDPNTLVVPFIFVAQGDPLPIAGLREHPDWIRVPATFVPRPPAAGESGPQWNVQVGTPDAPVAGGTPAAAAEPGIPGSFAPPAPRQKRLPNGQPWPKDGKGRDWPKDRWGRPMRPLWDYPPGVRAPGEGIAPGAPDSVSVDEAIDKARAALAALDLANVRTNLATDHPAAQENAPGKRAATAPATGGMPGDGAHAKESLQSTAGGASTDKRNGSEGASRQPDPGVFLPVGKNNFATVGWGDSTFYPSQWDIVRQISGGDHVTFVAGNTISIEASSLAYPTTNQFRWTATAEPLNDDGTPQVSVGMPGWSNPVEYSSGLTGGSIPNHFVLQATSPAPKQRWTVSIPPQEDAHGNYLDDLITVYTPKSRY
jgi:hypothetical protein